MNGVRKKVLIIGGYGAIGKQVALLLKKYTDISLRIAGPSINKAQEVSGKLSCDYLQLDINDKQSVFFAINEANVVINCCIKDKNNSLGVAKLCASHGIDYIDVACMPLKHFYGITDLYQQAATNNCTLITGIGVNPGIMGLLIKSHILHHDTTHNCDSYLVLGSNFSEMTALSLVGISAMGNVPPQTWSGTGWMPARKHSKKQYIKGIFKKNIQFSISMITPDILRLPYGHSVGSIQLWSGLENTWQAILLFFGAKLGFGSSEHKAKSFLNVLRIFGKKGKNGAHFMLKSEGIKDGAKNYRITSMDTDQIRTTAIGATIACRQLVENKINMHGAFFATDIIDLDDFMHKLKEQCTQFEDTVIAG